MFFFFLEGTYRILNMCGVLNNDHNGLSSSSVLLTTITTVRTRNMYLVIYRLRFVKTGDSVFRDVPHVLAIYIICYSRTLAAIFVIFNIPLSLFCHCCVMRHFDRFYSFAFVLSLSKNILGHLKIQGAVNRWPFIAVNRLRAQAVFVWHL